MFNKKFFMVLLLFLIVVMGAISHVAASDLNAIDEMATGDASIEEIATNEISGEDLNELNLADDRASQNSNAEILADEEPSNDQEPSDDVTITPTITLSQSGTTAKNKVISVKVIDSESGLALNNTTVSLSFLNSKGTVVKTLTLTTNEEGQASSKISLSPGIYTVQATIADTGIVETLTNFKLTMPVKITATKLTTIFNSTKKFQVKVLDEDKKAVSGLKLKVKVYTGSKYKTYTVKTNSKGIATIKVSSLKLGKHKVVITSADSLYTSKSVSSLIKINPRPVTIKVSTYKGSDGSAFYALFKDKTSKKYADGVKVKVLIYTGKKYKTYKLVSGYYKDDKKHGVVAYVSNSLSVGTHKVKLVVYGNYKGTKTSKITILKSAKKYDQMYGYISKGKMTVYVKVKGKWYKA